MTSTHKNFLLSVIIPVYNEEGNIEPLLTRLTPILSDYSYEIIFVNDGSRDKTAEEVKEAASKNKNIKIISLVRNFHHQVALTAGYHFAKGDAVVSIDADLQDPPELIREMVKKWQEGYMVVYAKRAVRHEGFFKTLTAKAFYRLIDLLSDTDIPQNVGDYRLIDKEVVSMLNNMPEKSRFLRGLVAWGGFPSTEIPFERNEREIGTTHYPLKKMITLALDGIVSFSTKPLKFAMYMGFFSALLGMLGIVYAIYRRFLLPQEYWVEGWTATFVGIMFFGGVQLVTIGIIGEYIGRIYTQVQGRPPFLIKEKINID
ncbi:glycosyltransferase family 2 protein [Candidatus Woesebacteria bacterium]|jgi:dolichol-phosphate mannosyltransferase|nr:glycosyltransferase family 2 protein [Candidatus Woesebacteria bacterium]